MTDKLTIFEGKIMGMVNVNDLIENLVAYTGYEIMEYSFEEEEGKHYIEVAGPWRGVGLVRFEPSESFLTIAERLQSRIQFWEQFSED